MGNLPNTDSIDRLMLANIFCQTPSRFVKAAWISLQPKGDISFGLNDRAYISSSFRARNFVWNMYNRVTAEYEIQSDISRLEPVKNPHFIFHAPIYFHLTTNKGKADDALWAGICETRLVLKQQTEMPWIRAITTPLHEMK